MGMLIKFLQIFFSETILSRFFEPPQIVASRIRNALKYLPPERLILSSDCGFGREGLSRRIAFFKTVSLVQGTNIIRKELGLPEVTIRAENPKFAFGQIPL